MANRLTNTDYIAFLHGSENSLQTLRNGDASKIVPGTFYITNDTNRMYLGVQENSVNKIVPLNQGVITVDKVANLPTSNIEVGYFYYATEENILCVYNGSQWVQINPDTSISKRELTVSKSGENYLQVNDSITTSDNASYTAFWGFDETDGNVTISVAEKTEGTGAAAITRQMFTIKCDVTIGTEKSTNTGIIKLSNSGDDTKKVTIKPGADSKLTVTSDSNGNITIDDAGLRNNDIKKITHTIDANGIIKTELTKENNNTDIFDTFKPQISYGKASATATEATKTANFGTVTSSADGEFDIGTAKLDVYTTGEVDALITDAKSTLNAMVFKGTLNGSTSVLPSLNDNVCIGDTYKVAVNKKYYTDGTLDTDSIQDSGKQWATIGDLFIATGTEVNGIITSGLVWEYIPSGNEENVVYTFTTQEHGFTVNEGTQVDLDFKLASGTAITLTDTDTADEKGKTITIKHSDVMRNPDGTVAAITQTAADLTDYESTNDIIYIKEVETNDQGHVTKVNTQKVTLIDTNASVKKVDLSAKNTTDVTNSVDLTSKVTLQHPSNTTNANDFKTDSITLKSLNDNLSVSANNAGGIEFKLVWGTF